MVYRLNLTITNMSIYNFEFQLSDRVEQVICNNSQLNRPYILDNLYFWCFVRSSDCFSNYFFFVSIALTLSASYKILISLILSKLRILMNKYVQNGLLIFKF